MTAYAPFGPSTYPASTGTLDAAFLTATLGNNTQAYVPLALTSGRYRFQVTFTSSDYVLGMGISEASGIDTTQTGYGSSLPYVWVQHNSGNIVGSGGASGSVGAFAAGDVADICFDTGAGVGSSGVKQFWIARVRAGVSTDYNGTPGANPDTNTGGQPCADITNFTAFLIQYGGTNGVGTLNSGATAYVGNTITTFSNLPNAAALTVGTIGAATADTPLSIAWTATGGTIASGLDCQVLDPGNNVVIAWTAMTGTTTGASGTALGPTLSIAGIYRVQIRDSGQHLDYTQPSVSFYCAAAQSGTGAVLLDGVYDSHSPGGTLGNLGAPASGIVFSVNGYSNGLNSGFSFNVKDELGGTGAYVAQIGFTPGYLDGTKLGVDVGIATSAPSSGGTIYYGDLPSAGVSGTISATSNVGGGTVFGTANAAGGSGGGAGFCDFAPGSNITNSSTHPAGDTDIFQSWLINTGTVFGHIAIGYRVYAIAGETLTITGASVTASGSLRLVGTGPGTLSALNISEDNGATFAGALGFSISGTDWAAQGPILDAGTYPLVVQDPATSVDSAAFPLTVTETITLNSLSIGVGPSLTADGTVSYFDPSNVDISVNGTWHNSDSFSLTSGAWPETLTAGLNSVSTGTLTVRLRDHTNTSVISNPGTIVVSGEAITLTAASAYVNQNGHVAGTISGGTPAALDVAINGTWYLLSNFVLSAGNFTGTVTGNRFPSPCSYTFQVRDHALPYIESNILTESVGYQEQIILQVANPTPGALQMSGVTNYGPPAGMDYTINGGGSWASVLTYHTDAGTYATPFNATGAPLSIGNFTVRLRDAADHTVLSNPININVGGAEVLTLTKASPAPSVAARGSLGDMLNRLRALLPQGWFPRDGMFAGLGGPLLLAGTATGGPPSWLNVSVDGGITWRTVSNYVVHSTPSLGTGIVNSAWTAVGPDVGPGAFNVQVEDAGQISVKSNFLLLAVLDGYTSAAAPVLTAILSGPAAALARIYSLIAFVRAQMRLQSSTGGWIDLWAYDFFGPALRRRATEQDAPFVTRIGQNLLAPLVTRQAMVQALTNLTGEAPDIFEAFNTTDAGCYGAPTSAYGIARYGSQLMNAQCLIKVNRPPSSLAGPIPAYGSPMSAYGIGASFYFPASEFPGVAQNAEILATINKVKAAGVICWVNTGG